MACDVARRRRAPTGSSRSLAELTAWLGADHVLLGRRRVVQRPGRGGRPAGPRPGPGRRHRQGEARPALERLLRQGARRPLLPVVRAGPLRRRLRARRASTTRPATSAGPNDGTSSASSTCSPGEALPVDRSSPTSFPVAEAADVYGRLRSGELHGRRFPLRVPERRPRHRPTRRRPSRPRRSPLSPARRRPARRPRRRTADRARCAVGFIGAGNYASSMLLPHLAAARGVELAHVVTNTSLSAANAQRRFGFARGVDRRRRAARRRHDRRRLRRDPPPHPRRARLPGARGRQGDVRREAARPRPTRSWPASSRSCARPATTG